MTEGLKNYRDQLERSLWVLTAVGVLLFGGAFVFVSFLGVWQDRSDAWGFLFFFSLLLMLFCVHVAEGIYKERHNV